MPSLKEIQKGPVPVELIMENARMHARELLKREARKDPSLRVTGPIKV